MTIDDVRDDVATTAARFLRDSWPLRLEAPMSVPTRDELRDYWTAMLSLGWPWIIGSVEDANCLTTAPVVEGLFTEFGCHPTPAPVFDLVIATPVLYAMVGDHRDGLAPYMESEVMVLASLGEHHDPNGPTDPWQDAEIRNGRLHGAKSLVSFARHADAVAVTATTGGQPCIALVAAGSPGVVVDDIGSIDRLEQLGALRLDDAEATVLCEGQLAVDVWNQIECLSMLGVCAELLGVARTSATMSIEYANARTQFGRPIGSFQALKHLLADAWIDVYALESAVARAARIISETSDAAEARHTAKLVRVFADTVAANVRHTALQVHGGIGFTAENPLSWYFNRSVARAGTWGSPHLAVELGSQQLERRL